MTENRLAGLALIAGSCGMIITMAFHPHGHVTSAELPRMIRMLILVHGLALACIPVMFLGTWGLSRRIATPSRLDVAGLVLYAFGLIAVMGAAVADGLVTPRVLEQIVASADSQSTMETWRMFSAVHVHLEPGIRASVRGGVFGGNHRLGSCDLAEPEASAWPRNLWVHSGAGHDGGSVLGSSSAGCSPFWGRHAGAIDLVRHCRGSAVERRSVAGARGLSGPGEQGRRHASSAHLL